MRSTVAIFRKPISLRCGSFAASTSTSARLPQPISSPTPPPGGKTKLGANNARSPQHDEYAGRREIPGKDAEIIVEDRLTLLVREMIRVLPEVRPFAPEAAYVQRIPVIAGSNLN